MPSSADPEWAERQCFSVAPRVEERAGLRQARPSEVAHNGLGAPLSPVSSSTDERSVGAGRRNGITAAEHSLDWAGMMESLNRRTALLALVGACGGVLALAAFGRDATRSRTASALAPAAFRDRAVGQHSERDLRPPHRSDIKRSRHR